jgi:hypothetical protein
MFQIQFLMNSNYYTIPYVYETMDEAEEESTHIKIGYEKRIISVNPFSQNTK